MPNHIYWMLVDSHQVPPEAWQFLSISELSQYRAFRFPKRGREWLLGRWNAKALAHSLPAYRHYPLNQIEIATRPEGAPYLRLPDRVVPAGCLTISHSGNLAACALITSPGLQIGVDLEKIEARPGSFVQDYFTGSEQQLVEQYPVDTRALLTTLVWSVKESMLKALGVGLHWDTRRVEVESLEGILSGGIHSNRWRKISIREQPDSGRVWMARWRRQDAFVLTLAGYSAAQAPIQSVRLLEKHIEE